MRNSEEVIEKIESAMGVKFSESQLQALTHIGSPLNILSCAGSGKTTTLIGKMLYMEMFYEINPAKILAITFNKEAIDEMSGRYKQIRKQLGLPNGKAITFRTYHSLYHLILNSKYTNRSWKEIGDYNKYKFILDNFCQRNINGADEETLEDVMSLRGYQINNLLSFEELSKTPKFLTTGIEERDYRLVIDYYEQLKKEKETIDFDDLQIMMYEEMLDNEKVVEVIKSAWDYIVVDEYQDISKVQLEILKMMIKDKNKLTAIGDDEQSIYEFRGSKAEYIIDFHVHFNGAERIVMDTNYRVPENILMPVVNSIRKNKNRVDKEIKAHKGGGELVYTISEGLVDSASSIVTDIKKFRDAGGDLDEVVILIRNNKQQRMVLDALLEEEIPVVTRSNYAITNHLIVRDLEGIINLAIDPTDSESFKKVFLKMVEYVSRKQVDYVSHKMFAEGKSWREEMLQVNNNSVHHASYILERVGEYVKMDKSFKEIVELIEPVYKNYLLFLVNKYSYNWDELKDILAYVKKVGEEKTFKEFYSDCKRKESLKRFFEGEDSGVRISTMHRMKGLEFERVYLLDLTEDILPNARIEEKIRFEYGDRWADDYLEQERRLFYVAWTRARSYLNVVVSNRNPSRFILETIGMN